LNFRQTADLEKINQSKLVLTRDESFIDCQLHPKDYANDSEQSCDISLDEAIFIAGDLKWLAMLLGMEGMSTYWCIHCMLGKAGFKDADHTKGDPCTIEGMKQIRELYDIDDPDNDTTKNGVKAKPFWDFIPVANYCLPLLHIWMGVFNDIDTWFMSKVDGFVWKDAKERLIKDRLTA
jgi:hypothetical protein